MPTSTSQKGSPRSPHCRAISLALSIGLLATHAGAAEFVCPESVVMNGTAHMLGNAAVFDGPPEEITSLVPEFIGDLRRWELDPSINPYLVCQYKDWSEVLIVHAKGATTCEVTQSPIRANCALPAK